MELKLRVDEITYSDAQHVCAALIRAGLATDAYTPELVLADAVKVGLHHMKETWCNKPEITVSPPEKEPAS